MPLILADHHLKDFDTWFEAFKTNPPPKIGHWRLLRGRDDPNRVYVIGEVRESDVKDIQEFLESEKMLKLFERISEESTAPLEFVWLDDVSPG